MFSCQINNTWGENQKNLLKVTRDEKTMYYKISLK